MGPLIILLTAALSATPCAQATVMRPGQLADCEGILVPADDVRWALETDADLTTCNAGLSACNGARELERAAWEQELLRMEEMLAMRTHAPSESAGFDWTALFVGIGVGLVAGGAIAYAVVK